MISLPDFKEKKIIFITPKGNFENQLKFGNSNLKVYEEKKCVNQISIHSLLTVFIVGEFTITSYLIKRFIENGIGLICLNFSFKPYAEIYSVAEGNTILREIQYKSNKKFALNISKIIIKNKIENQFKLLTNYLNIEKEFDLAKQIEQIELIDSIDSLRGIEGNFASLYFKNAFKDLKWRRRAPTTKEDIPNFLLDIGYTFLFNLTEALLKLFGFDTYKGFLHQLYFQRKSLSCDVMEPMRVIIDKALIKAFNLGRIDEKDFKYYNGSFQFKDFEVGKKYTGIFYFALMERKDEIYQYILDFYRYIQNQDKYSIPEFIF